MSTKLTIQECLRVLIEMENLRLAKSVSKNLPFVVELLSKGLYGSYKMLGKRMSL